MKHHATRLAAVLACCALGAAAWAAREASPFAGPGFHSRGSWSGFEDHEQELGSAVAKAILEVAPKQARELDFTGRERQLGHGVATVIRTLNVDSPYQHETNDALVKMTLNYIQFAKDHDMVSEMIDHDLRTEMPMLRANGRRVAESGDIDIALMAVTERTACFYQLVEEVRRAPHQVSYRSPYGTVLRMTRQLGQHTLTEKEIHEIYTVPRLRRQAEQLGVEFEVTPWRDDGWITITVKPRART